MSLKPLPLCVHRWSTIKRWQLGESYNVIQRCRRCDSWIRRVLNLKGEILEMKIDKIVERQ